MKQYEIYKEEIRNNRERIYVVHYACSDLNKPKIEISSICAFKLESHSPFKQFSRNDYPSERSMLKAFWDFVEEVNPIIVGWNINKPNIYGPEVLQKRYEELSHSKKTLPSPKSFDLVRWWGKNPAA